MAALLFILDPLESLKAYKDSSVAMMRAAAARGHVIWAAEPHDLCVHWPSTPDQTVCVQARAAKLKILNATAAPSPWYEVTDRAVLEPQDIQAILMRKDPPYDVNYHVCTQLLEHFEGQGVAVFNRPRALRDHGEKTSVLEFSQWAPQGMITTQLEAVQAFASAHARIVLKPLDAMGGSGIFLSHASDPNLPVILETLSEHGRRQIMVQRWLPEIVEGDKRVLLINGEPFPYCLARIPPEGASRGNLAAGGRGEARPLSETDLRIAQALGPILKARGLFLVGLDIIGEHLTEINVTSPTGFQEIAQQTGSDPALAWIEALEARL
ncbi:MAG: glutathione synthase [Burkholderiaceae bacterium]